MMSATVLKARLGHSGSGVSLLSFVNIPTTMSQNKIQGKPTVLREASKLTISASLLLCVTAPCRFTNQVIGQKVLGPTKAKYAPLVLLEWGMSAANEASQNKNSPHFSGGSPTKLT